MGFDDAERVQVETAAQWRTWLDAHAAGSSGAWLVTWRKASGRPAPSYDEVVTEALAVGWVDSRPRALDDERTMLWFSPRRPTSAWSRPNKVRVALLEEQGRMGREGARLVELAKENGAWSLLDDVEDLVVPEDLAEALAARPGAREQWDDFPPSTRRGVLEWLVQAKRPQTRAKRVQDTAEKAARGERANQWAPKG